MNSDINLVSGNANALDKGTKTLMRHKLIGTFAIIGVVIIAILLFLLSRLFSPDSIIKQQNQVTASISLQQSKQAKLVALTQRLNDISSLLKKRTNYDVVLSNILAQSPSGISIVSVSVDKKKISVIVNSSSLLSLNDFIEMLKGMVEKKQFLKNVTINNLGLNGRAGYVLTADIDLL